MNVPDFLSFISTHIPTLCKDEGVRVGDPNAEVRGILVCFMATVDALQKARREGCNLVVCHEDPFLPYEGLFGFPQTALTWSANRLRLKEATEGGLTVLRLHSGLDQWLVYDSFLDLLGLPARKPGEGFETVYDAAPATVGDWIERTKEAVDIECVRFIGDPGRVVSKIGVPWGGLGLFVNVSFIEKVIANGAELLIGGESDDYALRYMTDAGVAFIEAGHSPTENPGLQKFSEVLQAAFPDLKVAFHRSPQPFSWSPTTRGS